MSYLGTDWLLHTDCIRLQAALDGVDMGAHLVQRKIRAKLPYMATLITNLSLNHPFDCIENGAEEIRIQWDPISIREAAALSATLVMITNQCILNDKKQLMFIARSAVSNIVSTTIFWFQ